MRLWKRFQNAFRAARSLGHGPVSAFVIALTGDEKRWDDMHDDAII